VAHDTYQGHSFDTYDGAFQFDAIAAGIIHPRHVLRRHKFLFAVSNVCG